MLSVATKQVIKKVIGKALANISVKEKQKLSVILNYHSIHPTHPASIVPDVFQRQMEYLVSRFQVVSLDDFYNLRVSKKELPDKLAVVTFDDGYADNYEYAFPILKKLGIKAHIFLTTGFVNQECDITLQYDTYKGLKALSWKQICEMSQEGISFGTHTHTHPILADIPLGEVAREFEKSRILFCEHLQKAPEFFAYPLGQARTFNSEIIALLKTCEFKLACSTIWGCDNSLVDLFALHRVRIDRCDSFNDFEEKIAGKWDFIRWFQLLRR